MAHTYVVQGIFHGTDAATVIGTVDGIPVTASCSWHDILNQPNIGAFQTFITTLMLENAFPPNQTSFILFNGTWTV